jgi:hypothetical protein
MKADVYEAPTRINVHCTEKACVWSGLDETSKVLARKLAVEHIEHTGHSVMITTETWLEARVEYRR